MLWAYSIQLPMSGILCPSLLISASVGASRIPPSPASQAPAHKVGPVGQWGWIREDPKMPGRDPGPAQGSAQKDEFCPPLHVFVSDDAGSTCSLWKI